jgi:hypothetical protein
VSTAKRVASMVRIIKAGLGQDATDASFANRPCTIPALVNGKQRTRQKLSRGRDEMPKPRPDRRASYRTRLTRRTLYGFNPIICVCQYGTDDTRRWRGTAIPPQHFGCKTRHPEPRSAVNQSLTRSLRVFLHMITEEVASEGGI